MVFTSHAFLFYFLPLVLAGYYLTPRSWRSLFLVIASYLFYGWWSPWFVLLMMASTVIDFYCGRAIASPGANTGVRRAALTTSIVANLSLLGFFKYFMFASASLNQALGWIGAGPVPIHRDCPVNGTLADCCHGGAIDADALLLDAFRHRVALMRPSEGNTAELSTGAPPSVSRQPPTASKVSRRPGRGLQAEIIRDWDDGLAGLRPEHLPLSEVFRFFPCNA